MKTFLGARPSLFFPLFSRRSSFDDLLVRENTDVCIEGFPRSANSFAVGAFRQAQRTSVEVAHHTHVPANPMRACELEIPTLVLIRDPRDAVVSHVALTKEVQLVEENAETPTQLISFRDQIEAWWTFYSSLGSYRDELCVAPFDVVVEDMGRVIGQMNDRLGTNFARFDHTEEAVEEVHAGQGYHSGPSERRARLKEETRLDFDEQLRTDPSLRRALSTAESLYDEFASGEGMRSSD